MVQESTWNLQVWVLLVQKNLHYSMKSVYFVFLYVLLLSTVHCDSSSESDDTNLVTQNGITDIDSKGKYDAEAYEATTSPTLETNHYVSEADSPTPSSLSIKHDETETSKKSSTFLRNNAEHDSAAATTSYLISRAVTNVADRITTMYTSKSEYTKTQEKSLSDVTLSTTSILSIKSIQVDACNSTHVQLTNNPVILNAFANQTNCSILVTAPKTASMSIKLLDTSLNDVTTYFYIEHLERLPQHCPDRFVSVLVDYFPCVMMIRGGRSRFHFQNTNVTIEIRTSDVRPSSCFETDIKEQRDVQCNSTSYESEMTQITKDFRYFIDTGSATYVYDFRVSYFMAKCTCDCPDICFCILDYRQWISMCPGDKVNTNIAQTVLIVYKPTIQGVFFSNMGLNKIKQNAFSGFEVVEVLDLKHNYLSMLPPTICKNLPQLKILLLSHNSLSNMNFDLFKGRCEKNLLVINLNNNMLSYVAHDLFISTTNLHHLDLSQNKLSNIANDTFKTLTQLYSLNMAGNRLSKLDASVFDSQYSLIASYLSDNNLTALPSSVFQSLGSLETLKLSHNQISVLPSEVFNSLNGLQTLDLKDNHISVLPPGVFATLYWLQILNMNDNSISVLPSGIFDSLEELTDLLLSNNHISVLPKGVFQSLFNLHTLHLSDNNISVLPLTALDFLIGLTDFNLSGNIISVLPLGVFYYQESYLETLDLSNNKITALPSNVFQPLRSTLRVLNLNDNNISILPVGLFDLRELYTLNLKGNNISILTPGIFDSLVRLYTLELSDNHISVLPVGVFDSLGSEFRTLDLHANNISTLHGNVFKSLTGLYTLVLNSNVIINLPGDVFKELRLLKTLDMSYIVVRTIPSELFVSQEHLLTLDISNNNLAILPADSFSTLKKLILLNLCCNNLTTIASETFETLVALQVLDLSKNSITQFPEHVFLSTTNILSLDVSENYLNYIHSQCFGNLSLLTYLNLSKNSLSRLPSFSAQGQLQVLDLSENRIARVPPAIFDSLSNLTSLSLSMNDLVSLPGWLFYHLNNLLFLNVSNNVMQKIGPMIFSKQSKLQTFDMRENELAKVKYDSFKNPQNAIVIVDKYATCCFMDDAQCASLNPRPEYLTCNRMLQNVFLRISVWIFGLSAFICNGIAYFIRTRKRQGSNKVQTLLISHLALSDLLMGVNMLILAVADAYYGGYFPSYSHTWRQGFACKLAGFLSIFSSEGSVFFIALISIDRMLGIKYPFGGHRLTTKWARISVALAWLTAFLISAIPIGLVSDKGDIFSTSEVCIGIPIVRRHSRTFKSEFVQVNITSMIPRTEYDDFVYYHIVQYKYVEGVEIEPQQSLQNITYQVAHVTGSQIASIFSIIVFIGVNLTCFFIVALCYMYIYFKASETSEGAGRTIDRNEQIRMAKKMFAIVFTDFCCWVPLGFICILAQCGVVEVSPKMYAWTVGFILPINSSINPFLYVLYEAIAEHLKKRREERNTRETIEMQARWRPLIHFGLRYDQNK